MVEVRCPLLVGRERDLAMLRAALASAAEGSGGVVFVTGEPGVGKSRLVRALAEDPPAAGVAFITGRALPASGSTPYRPLTEALLQALRDRPFPEDPDLAPWRTALRSVVPILTGDGGHGDYSPAVRGEAVLRLLRRIARPRGLVLVLEDLHWADPDTLAVLEFLGDNLAGEPVLCVATTRSEPRSEALDVLDRLRARGRATAVPLDRLSREDVAVMVRACRPDAGPDLIVRVQDTAEGVPFFVEEVLATPGVPRSLADPVRARLAELSEDDRAVLGAASLLGREFDWRLLPAATRLPSEVVARAVEDGVASMLLVVAGDFFRFRHALTREAVIDALAPTRRSSLAAATLAAVEAAHPGLPGPWRDVAGDLAARCGDRERAGELCLASGRAALERGALATAVASLRRATDFLGSGAERVAAATLLIESLALAGRVDEAMAAGDTLLAEIAEAGAGPTVASQVHLRLAHAAVAATRWQAAAEHLDAAGTEPSDATRAAVLRAEVALAVGDVDDARARAEAVLESGSGSPEVICNAFELIGRAHRTRDLEAAREAFERALATADAAKLPVWRLRALHELGTIEMFDHAGTDRLRAARRAADELGALSTGAMIDVQLAATHLFRFDLDVAQRHAEAAAALTERLALGTLRANALVFLAQIHALRRERDRMERYITLARAAAPDDREIEGSAWGGARAMLALLDADLPGALDALGRGVAILQRLPRAGPAHYRGLWPLLLAATGDRRASAAIVDARDAGMTVNRLNRALLAYAEAVLAGRRGEDGAARASAAEADLVHYPVWSDIARFLASGPALADDWGQPRAWLEAAADRFAAHALPVLAERCRELAAGGASLAERARLGITARESEVLHLVAGGLANKEIATALGVSPRTVEKHIESLLRKTGARSRTHLVAVARVT